MERGEVTYPGKPIQGRIEPIVTPDHVMVPEEKIKKKLDEFITLLDNALKEDTKETET